MLALPVRYRTSEGKALISVTQILSLAGRIDSTWFTPAAALRGQMVHHFTELIDDGVVFVNAPELDGYVTAYRRFLRDCRPVYAGSEVEVMNGVVGGRIDRVVKCLFGHEGLLDFKTSEQADWHGQQLAFYNWLKPTGARWGVYLRADGRYRLRQYDNPQDHRRNMYDLARVRGLVQPDGDFWTSGA